MSDRVIAIRAVEIHQSLSENQSFKVTIQSNSDDDDDDEMMMRWW